MMVCNKHCWRVLINVKTPRCWPNCKDAIVQPSWLVGEVGSSAASSRRVCSLCDEHRLSTKKGLDKATYSRGVLLFVPDDADGSCNQTGEPVPPKVEHDSQPPQSGRHVRAPFAKGPERIVEPSHCSGEREHERCVRRHRVQAVLFRYPIVSSTWTSSRTWTYYVLHATPPLGDRNEHLGKCGPRQENLRLQFCHKHAATCAIGVEGCSLEVVLNSRVPFSC